MEHLNKGIDSDLTSDMNKQNASNISNDDGTILITEQKITSTIRTPLTQIYVNNTEGLLNGGLMGKKNDCCLTMCEF